MTIQQWLQKASQLLKEQEIPSAQLDVELLLADTLKKSREYLHAHDDEKLTPALQKRADSRLKRRYHHEPVAYIVGKKNFYGRDFIVTPETLIPRPETEIIIELFKKHSLSGRILDVGTGSGCIGLTIKAEDPSINLTLSDISNSALNIARKNAKQLNIKPVRYVTSDLLDHWLSHKKPKQFDVVVANLPYVDHTWDTSPEIAYEPSSAIYAEDKGLFLVKRLITHAPELLSPKGYLVLETDTRQHKETLGYAQAHGFTLVDQEGLILLFRIAN